MARVLVQHVAQETDGDIRGNRAVTITKADGSAFDGTWFDAVSGGSVVLPGAITTNGLGLVKLWADLDKAQRLKVTVDGDAVATDSETIYDPADVFLKSLDQTATGVKTFSGTLVGSGTVTLSGTTTASGAVTSSGGLTTTGAFAVTRNADSYATFQNTHANGKGLAVLDPSGNNLLVARRVGSNDVVAINSPDGFISGASTLQVLGTQSGSHVQIDSQFESTGTAGTDSGAIRGVARQISGSTALRAVEAQTIRPTGTGPNDTWGIEVGIRSEVAGTNPGMNVGIKILSNSAGWGVTGLRNNSGILIGGPDGWDDYINCYDTNGSTVGFRVAGGSLAGDAHGDVIITGRYRTNVGLIAVQQGSAPTNPAASSQLLYPKTDTRWYRRTSAGTDVQILDATTSGVIPQANVANTSNQLITNATVTALAFTSENWDVGGWHDNSVANNRLTAAVAGRYRVSARASFDANATGYRVLAIRKNGSTVGSVTEPAVNGEATAMHLAMTVDLTATEWVDVTVFQTSTGDLNILGASPSTPTFDIVQQL